MEYTKKNVAGMIDHTLLKADATEAQIAKLCQEAKEHGFASVCVNPGYVAIAKGAAEVDMVVNVGRIKSGNWDYVRSDIAAVVNAARGRALTKVIIETCLLTDDEKIRVCEIAKDAGADFVKTSTGFSTGGATAADIALMRKTVGPDMGVKASGGIHSTEEAIALIEAGASRIGASAGIAIISGLEK